VRFSDLNRLPIDTIQANLQTTGFSSQAEVRRGDAFSMLETAPTRPFDYVYIAPPQYKEMAFKALLLLDANPGWLNDEGAWVIVQIHPREYRKLELQSLEEFEQRKYGSTLLVFYEKK
jgi:16S rRNA G966 N2-methylase RsmD